MISGRLPDRTANLLEELLRREGFGEHGPAERFAPFGKTAHQKDAHAGVAPHERTSQLLAIEAGHGDIGQQQVERPGAAGQPDGFLAVARFEDFAPGLAEDLPDEAAHLRLIFHKQHADPQ